VSALSAQEVRLAKRMATDAATAELARAFREKGIRWLLLKGPVVAARLYKDGTFRDYVDIDVLVAPSEYEAAADVVRGLGYEMDPHLPRAELEHAYGWKRSSDRSAVDLHHYVPHLGASAEKVWAAFTRDAEGISVGGEWIEVTGYPAFALVMVFHALHNAPEGGKHIFDLERAVAQIPFGEWEKARELARELEAERNLATGLMLTPAASSLGRKLGLPRVHRWERVLRSGPVSRLTLPMRHVSNTKGVVPKLRALRTEMLPSKETRPFFEKSYSSSWMPLLFLQRIGRIILKAPLAVAVWYVRRKDRRSA
jgi:Uncharacterised nucleotidyltransferase